VQILAEHVNYFSEKSDGYGEKQQLGKLMFCH
jgi:hypothetical protein